jgi:hypothetical protein
MTWWPRLQSWLQNLRTASPMAFPTWVAPFADGWYPRLSPDGRYLLCGSTAARIVDLQTKQVIQFGGPPQVMAVGWLNPTQAVVEADLSGTDKQWRTHRLDAPLFQSPTLLGPGLSFNGAGGNRWAGGTTTQIWSGDPNGHAVNIAAGYGASCDETGTVCYSIDVHTAGKIVVWRNGQILRTVVPAAAANRQIIGAGGYVGYGYYGPSWINTPENKNLQVNVTAAESPPLAFRHGGAVWLATTNDNGVYLRPLGVTDRAITVSIPYHAPHGGAVDCSVVSLGAHILVASNDAKGQLQVATVPADAPLAPILKPPVPPRPEPGPDPPAGTAKATIATYDAEALVNEKARAIAKVTFGTPTHFRWQFKEGETWRTAVTNPARDLDHSYTFAKPGRYPIRLQTLVDETVTDTSSSRARAITVSEGPTPPGPDPGPEPPEPEPPPESRKGIVHGNTFVFTDDTGQWLPWGTSLFWGLYGYLHERDRLEKHLTWIRGQGADYIRVICTGLRMGDRERSVSPKDPRFSEAVTGLTALAASKGLRVQYTIFGAVYDAPSPSERASAVDKVSTALQPHKAAVWMIEIANEGWTNGFEGDAGAKELKALAQRVRSKLPNLVATTCPKASDDITEAMIQYYYKDCPAATCQTLHFSRSTKSPDGIWRPTRKPWREQNFDVAGCCKLVQNNEPRGPESSVTETNDPLVLACDAANTWLCGVGSYLLHTGSGVYGVAQPERGRPANLWETQNILKICEGLRTVRRVLPPNLPNWSKHQSNSSSAPFSFVDVPAEQFTCAYSATSGPGMAMVIGGVVKDTTFTLRTGSCRGRVYHPVTGQVLQEFTREFRATTSIPGLVVTATRT